MDINRKCRFCNSNQTTVSSNQEYIYCLDCQTPNFYRCLCGSFDFEMNGISTVKCNNCKSHSWVPEFIWNSESAKEFIRLSKEESDKRKNLKKNKAKIEFSTMNMFIIGILIFCYIIKW